MFFLNKCIGNALSTYLLEMQFCKLWKDVHGRDFHHFGTAFFIANIEYLHDGLALQQFLIQCRKVLRYHGQYESDQMLVGGGHFSQTNLSTALRQQKQPPWCKQNMSKSKLKNLFRAQLRRFSRNKFCIKHLIENKFYFNLSFYYWLKNISKYKFIPNIEYYLNNLFI